MLLSARAKKVREITEDDEGLKNAPLKQRIAEYELSVTD